MNWSRMMQRAEWWWLLLAAGLLLIVSTWATWTVVVKYRQAAAEIAEIDPRHARLAGMLQDPDRFTQADDRLQANLARYIHPAEEDPSQTANSALQRVRELAARHGLRVSSSQAEPARDDEGLDRIGLKLVVDGDWPALVALLGELAQQEPAIYTASVQLGARGRSATTDLTFAQLDLYVLKERS